MYAYTHARAIFWIVVTAVLCACTALAQVQIGENTPINLSGSLGFGYSGGFGSYGGSNHGLNLTGNGTLSGYYYNPNFASFNIQPYYGRSQSNSTSQSILNDSGVIGTLDLFRGSHFPGSISYNMDHNGTGEFGIPGTSGLTTTGSTQGVTIAWSELLPEWPTLQATYANSGGSSSILGESGENKSNWKNLNLNSTYNIAGFTLAGNYNHQNNEMNLPAFLGPASSSEGSSSSIGFMAMHSLPLSGSFSANVHRSNYSSLTSSGSNDGTTTSCGASVSFMPFRRFSIAQDVRYTGNLLGALQQSVAGQGSLAVLQGDSTSRSIAFDTYANYGVTRHLQLSGHVTHVNQTYNGATVSDTRVGANANFNYSRPLFGLFNFGFGIVDSASERGNDGIGFAGNIGIERRVLGFDTGADFSYSQNVETLIAIYTTSSYSYGGSVRRKVNSNTYWSTSVRAAHSGLSQQAGALNRSESVSSSLTWRKSSFSGSYSQSHGETVLSSGGLLTPAPIPGLTKDFVFYNGRGYGFGVGYSPLSRLTLTANYSKVKSDTLASSLFSVNGSTRYDMRLDYQLRKLYLRSGYSRFQQSISASSTIPTVVNSYYFGISRWFNVF